MSSKASLSRGVPHAFRNRYIAVPDRIQHSKSLDAAKINSERVYGVLADQCPSMELDLNEVSRVSAPRIFEFTIAGG